jgi:hypothetical protein
VQSSSDSSEFRIPDSELEGSVELRVPSPQASQAVQVPSDKILLPRRVIYIEGVLYATIAAAAFGLGFIAGRGSSSTAGKDDARKVDSMQILGVTGNVSLRSTGGTQGDEGAVVIVLPAVPAPAKRLPIAGLRPDDPPPVTGDGTQRALAEFGGAAARVDSSGSFTLSVPAAQKYRVLILSKHPRRGPGGPVEPIDTADMGKFFESPADLLKGCQYRWLTKSPGSVAKIEEQFSE